MLAWAVFLGLAKSPTEGAAAQSPSYRSVTIGHITSGSALREERVETAGDLRWTGNELLLNVDHISAMWPLLIEMTALPPNELARIQAQCTVARGRPACRAKIRGEVSSIRNRRSLMAHEIELQRLAPQN